MYKANLSHNLLNSYLEELVDKNMVKEMEINHYKYLIITDKGLEFMQNIKKMKDFQEAFGIWVKCIEWIIASLFKIYYLKYDKFLKKT